MSRVLRQLLFVSLAMTTMVCPGRSAGDVVVLSNRTPRVQTILYSTVERGPERLQLAPLSSRPIFSDKPISATLATAERKAPQLLQLNCVYHLTEHAHQRLQRLDLGEGDTFPAVREWPERADVHSIPVLLCVDDEEPTTQGAWQARLSERIVKASTILQEHTGIGLRIAGFAQWKSVDHATSFAESLFEFEQSIRPPPGVLAIGFTSQYHIVARQRHMGGTRGPLKSHVLLREWSNQLGEPERLEFLLHELGHHLGATHSPESHSVMRPLLDNTFTRLASHKTQYDTANVLAMATLAEERRRRGATSLRECSPEAIQRLAQIYRTVFQSLPDDPGAQTLHLRFAAQLNRPPIDSNLDVSTRVLSIEAKKLATKGISGDQLTTRLVRTAANAVGVAPELKQRRSFLIMLGLAFDDTDTLVKHPRTKQFANQLDPHQFRAQRHRSTKSATARGRSDTAKHFFASATLMAASSANEAIAWGNTKEVFDAQGGSGLSFADLAANRAGVRFAQGVLDGSLPMEAVAKSFDINHFVPSLEGLPEGLQAAEFISQYGGLGDARFGKMLERIDHRISILPPYLLLTTD